MHALMSGMNLGVFGIVAFEQKGKEEHGGRGGAQSHIGIDVRQGGGLTHQALVDQSQPGGLRPRTARAVRRQGLVGRR